MTGELEFNYCSRKIMEIPGTSRYSVHGEREKGNSVRLFQMCACVYLSFIMCYSYSFHFCLSFYFWTYEISHPSGHVINYQPFSCFEFSTDKTRKKIKHRFFYLLWSYIWRL